MFRAGPFVAEHVDAPAEDAVQPNGVDLTLAGVEEPAEPGYVGREGKRVAGRRAVAPEDGRAAGDGGAVPTYRLEPGGYVARYGETVRIPEGHVGFLYPRSSLMRNGCMLTTAVWDAGYEGRGEGLLQVHHPVELERGARVAQLVLARADHEGTYDGSYQGEGTE